jgi:hypothetical protein
VVFPSRIEGVFHVKSRVSLQFDYFTSHCFASSFTTLTKSCQDTTPNSYLAGYGGLTALGMRSNRVPDVQTFRKSYLPHPDSELDILYVDLDLLNDLYPMVKAKLPFEDFDLGGLTGYAIPVRPAYPNLPILDVNTAPQPIAASSIDCSMTNYCAWMLWRGALCCGDMWR